VLVAAVFVAVSYFYYERNQRAQAAQLSVELKDFIFPTIPETTDARALRVAYAAVLNRLDPIFGMEGTDPDKLGESVDNLAVSVSRVASLYTGSGKDLIERVWHPIQFLKDIAAAERARQELITSPSSEDAHTYYRLLGNAIDSASTYAATLADVFRTNGAFSKHTVTFIGGLSTPPLFAAALEDYRTSLADKKRQLLVREACLDDYSEKCPSLENAFAALTASSTMSFDESHPPVPQIVRENAEIVRLNYSAASGMVRGTPGPLIVLNDSPCFTNTPTSYYQSWIAGTERQKSFALYYVNDLFFYDAKTFNGPHVTPQVKKEIPYLYQPAANLYLCPVSGDDLTRAITLDTLYPLLAGGAPASSGDMLYEADIISSVEKLKTRLIVGEKVLAQEIGEEKILVMERILHIARERSPRFDEVIYDAISNNSLIEVLALRKEPISLSAVLMSRGYAPLFLLSYNTSVSEPLRLVTPSFFDTSDFRLVSYNDVLKMIYNRAEILAFMSRWRQVQYESQ